MFVYHTVHVAVYHIYIFFQGKSTNFQDFSAGFKAGSENVNLDGSLSFANKMYDKDADTEADVPANASNVGS